jgi:hypothetical protein
MTTAVPLPVQSPRNKSVENAENLGEPRWRRSRSSPRGTMSTATPSPTETAPWHTLSPDGLGAESMEKAAVEVVQREEAFDGGRAAEEPRWTEFFCVGYTSTRSSALAIHSGDTSRNPVRPCEKPARDTADARRIYASARGRLTGFYVCTADHFVQLLDHPGAYHYSTNTDPVSPVSFASRFLEQLTEGRKKAVFDALLRRTTVLLEAPAGPAPAGGVEWIRSAAAGVCARALTVCTHLFRVQRHEHDLGADYRARCVAFADRLPWECMNRKMFQAAAGCVNSIGCGDAAAGHALQWTLRLAKQGDRFRQDDETHPLTSGAGRLQVAGQLQAETARQCMAYAIAGQTAPTDADANIVALLASWIPRHTVHVHPLWHAVSRRTDAKMHFRYRCKHRRNQSQFVRKEYAGTALAHVAASPLETILKHNRLARSGRSGGASPSGGPSTRIRNQHLFQSLNAAYLPAQTPAHLRQTANHRHWSIVALAPLFRRSVGACFARLHITRVMCDRTEQPDLPLEVIEATCNYAKAHARWENELTDAFCHLQHLETPQDHHHRAFTRSFAGAAATASDRLVAQVCFTLGISEYGLIRRSRARLDSATDKGDTAAWPARESRAKKRRRASDGTTREGSGEAEG